MTEPRIQYVTTSDGVNIAFASMGEGPPLVLVSTPGFSHVQRSWSMYLYQPLTQACRLIWYDPRGTGLSRRETGGSDGSPNQLR